MSAIALGLAAVFVREILRPDRERTWIRARSLAEALKSQAYLFLANVPPYDTADAVENLSAKAKELLGKVKDLAIEHISDQEKRKNLPANQLSTDEYIQVRVNDQIKYYKEARHQFILACEETISVENSAWMTERTNLTGIR